MSWEEMDALAQALPQPNEEEQRLLADFVTVFGTEQGQRVLGYLEAKTIQKPNLPNQAADGQAMAYLSFMREGENNLYRWIMQQIKRGKAKR